MSADNWSECPLCKKKQKELMNRVSAKQWSEIKEQFKHPEYDTDEQVREDYEIYFDEKNNWVFKGHAECGVCGSEWETLTEIKPTEPDWSHIEDEIESN